MPGRFSVLLILLSLLILPVFSVTAQTPTPDPACIGMQADDCAFFKDSQAAMAAVKSFNNPEFSIVLGGSGGTSTGNTLMLTGSGPMLVDDGQITALHLNIASLEGDLPEGTQSTPGEVIWLENMLYTATQNEADESISWTGTSTDSGGAELLMGVLTGNLLFDALRQPQVAVTQRLDDEEIDGQTLAVFQSNIDLVTLLLTPDILSGLESVLQSVPPDALGGSPGQEVNPEDFDIGGAIPFLAFLLTEDTAYVKVWINPEDMLVYRLEIVFDIVLDASSIDENAGVVGFQYELKTTLNEHNDEFIIEAPDEFEMQDSIGFDFSTFSSDVLSGDSAEGATQIPDSERYVVEESIAYDETVTGTLDRVNQMDVWGLQAQAGDVITITLKAATPDSSLDTKVYLRDFDGAELAFNDDHESTRNDLGIFDSLIEDFEIPADGEYRIVATWLTETRDGDYELTVEKNN